MSPKQQKKPVLLASPKGQSKSPRNPSPKTSIDGGVRPAAKLLPIRPGSTRPSGKSPLKSNRSNGYQSN